MTSQIHKCQFFDLIFFSFLQNMLLPLDDIVCYVIYEQI